jgi:formate/nitrite transporter FocA (FNT family)
MDQQTPSEEKESEHRRSPSGSTVYHTVLGEGEEEMKRSNSALFYSGLAAGLAMGLSLIAEGLLKEHLPSQPWSPLISKFGYSVGFVVVILGRQQLFTENTLTPILPLLAHKGLQELKNVLRLWSIVFSANLLGAFAIAWAISAAPIVPPEAREAIVAVADESLGRTFWAMFWAAMIAGWLIALIVWLLPYAESSHFWVIVLLTYLIGLGHFPHIVAGAVNVFVAALCHHAGWGEIVSGFLVPALLGNITGGVLLVAFLNHAQVASGKEK